MPVGLIVSIKGIKLAQAIAPILALDPRIVPLFMLTVGLKCIIKLQLGHRKALDPNTGPVCPR